MVLTVTNRMLMRKMHQQKISVDDDESVTQFLKSKSPNTASFYNGDVKKFVLFLVETNRAYSTLSEYLDRVHQIKRQNFDLTPSKRKYFGETELQAFINWLGQNGQSGRTVKRTATTILSYLKCYDIRLNMTKIRFPHAGGKKENKKHQWSRAHIKELIGKTRSLRDKSIYACIYQSGLGISDLLALNYWDVKGKMDNPPILIDLTRIKTGQTYRTFFGADSCFYLEQYLSTRHGLKNDSPLFASEGNYSKRDQRVEASTIHDGLRKLAKEMDFAFSAHS